MGGRRAARGWLRCAIGVASVSYTHLDAEGDAAADADAAAEAEAETDAEADAKAGE